MDWTTHLLVVAIFIAGVYYIAHSAKSLNTGIFRAWYNGTFADYYIHRADSPLNFYFHVVTWSLGGSFLIAVAAVILDSYYHFFHL